jgi:hypothetical protein
MKSNARYVCPALSALVLLMVASLPVCATNFTATFSGTPTFIPGSSPLGSVTGCVFGSPTLARTYTSQTLVTGTAGLYTFTATARSSPTIDPFLALYLGTFDPANPTVNLVGCNDDTVPGVNQLPTFSATLTAGATYTVVTTIYGPGTVNSGTVSFTVSPDITLVAITTSPAVQSVPALSDSGLIVLAALMGLAGFATLKRRGDLHSLVAQNSDGRPTPIGK